MAVTDRAGAALARAWLWLIGRLFVACLSVATRRPHDFRIGPADDAYLLRWWLIPRNRWFNVYLHKFLRSDIDRALHDHPWPNASILLAGRYREHTIEAGGIHRRVECRRGAVKLRRARAAHRVELIDGPCWSLFVTGPRVREWGFHVPELGWVKWSDFVDPEDPGLVRGSFLQPGARG